MARKNRGSTPTVPQKPKGRGIKFKLPPAEKPRKGHQERKAGGAHKPKDQKGNPRQTDKAKLKKGIYADAD